MNKAPLVFTIVALLCATGLGYATKVKADQRMRDLAATQTQLKSSEATLATRTTELGKATENLATAGKELEARAAEVAKLGGEVNASKNELATTAELLKTREAMVEKLQSDLIETNVKLAEEGVAKTTLEGQLADAQKEAAEHKLAYEQLKIRQKAEETVEAPRRVAASTAPSPNLTGSVLAVNEGLNFLVLSVGDRQGLSVNTSLLVTRRGQRVATLKVTSIEPRTSIAEVVPGTLARGQSVQPGDRIVLAGG